MTAAAAAWLRLAVSAALLSMPWVAHADSWYGSSSDRKTDYDRRIQDLQNQQSERDRASRAYSSPGNAYTISDEQVRRDSIQEQQDRAALQFMAAQRASAANSEPAVRHPGVSEGAVISRTQADLKSAADWLDVY